MARDSPPPLALLHHRRIRKSTLTFGIDQAPVHYARQRFSHSESPKIYSIHSRYDGTKTIRRILSYTVCTSELHLVHTWKEDHTLVDIYPFDFNQVDVGINILRCFFHSWYKCVRSNTLHVHTWSTRQGVVDIPSDEEQEADVVSEETLAGPVRKPIIAYCRAWDSHLFKYWRRIFTWIHINVHIKCCIPNLQQRYLYSNNRGLTELNSISTLCWASNP